MKTLQLNSFSYKGNRVSFCLFLGVLLSFLMLQNPAQAQNPVTITGKVTSSDGETLPGVSIKVKNSSVASSSDVEGNFRITVPSGNAVLIFSYIGFTAQEVRVDNRSSLNVVLQPDNRTLQEVVVVGYGTQKKVNLTGSVATVSGTTLTDRPAPNAANLIQGRVSGLQVTQPSAEPGRDNPNFLIRGKATFGGSSDPLVLIDGVTGSFNNLSPDDIENVTVLKDAASASIYGARAANGVILVTTKNGKKGRTAVSYRLNIGRHTPTALPDLITNSAEYMEMYNTAAARQNITFRYPSADIEKYRNSNGDPQYPNFNAVDYYINPATVTNHNVSVSGGGEKNTFNLSLGYLDQNAMIKGYKFKRYNGLLNYATQLSKKVNVGTIMNLTYKDRKEPPSLFTRLALYTVRFCLMAAAVSFPGRTRTKEGTVTFRSTMQWVNKIQRSTTLTDRRIST